MTQVLLIMDYQAAIVDSTPAAAASLDRAVTALSAARGHDVPVVFVRVAFRPGYPEITQRNRNFAPLPSYGTVFHEDDPGTALVPELGVKPDDIIVVKRRVGAFASDLGEVLRGLEADEVVLAGVVTSGVVLSTVRAAADLDYAITVLSDACADTDAEVHDVLIGKIFPAQAAVITTEEWVAKLP
jgi:nicotinamidase-related amidase